MRTTDIIRSVLDLIDQVEVKQDTSTKISNEPGEQTSRFKQIFAMLSDKEQGGYSNTPNEVVTDVDTVTTLAGGGVNGPKHPDDIRVKDPRGFE
jgi:hypothetical protein